MRKFMDSHKKGFNKTKKFGKSKPRWFAIDEEILALKKKYKEIETSSIKSFSDIPLSTKTQKGLLHGKYESPTDIQRESIILALQENDILGAAKTGSGKTLAFLIPVLECLYKTKWTQLDGLGALIISPTRELAYQIFEVLRIVGKFHDFSAGLVIGGKHLREEAERINRTNIVICTPGRLLQHMDETVNFNADNMQILELRAIKAIVHFDKQEHFQEENRLKKLTMVYRHDGRVLDEADRILDMGFQQSMNAIIENLPAKRQTLLFSATQTKSVKDLARLSLKDPMYVSVHENAKHSTPTQLQQNYIVCELHEKLDVLWSFIKNHLKKKILVFMASCKQVRFVYEVFRKLRPGITVLSLHGAMQQMKRVAMYESFCRKQNAVLLATDIAARGLDFPAVNWVIQMDCPEDANTYIHRAGRTARYEENGESLLILQTSEEEGMIEQLTDKKIPINKIRVNIKKMSSIQPKMESLCASDVQMKEFAQRAFVSYLKSVFFMKNKAVFDITKLDTDSFSRCLGLAFPPRIRFLQKAGKMKSQGELKQLKNKFKDKNTGRSKTPKNKAAESSSEDSESVDVLEEMKLDTGDKSPTLMTSDTDTKSQSSDSDSSEPLLDKTEKVKISKSSLTSKENHQNVGLSEKKEVLSFQEEEDDDDFLMVKKSVKYTSTDDESDISDIDDVRERNKKDKLKTKAALAKKILKKKLKVNTKVVFDEEGQEVIDVLKKTQNKDQIDDKSDGINISEARKRMQEADKIDKEIFKDRLKKKKLEKKIKAKEKKKATVPATEELDEEPEVMLGTPDQEFNSEDEDHFASEESGDTSDASSDQSEDSFSENDDDSSISNDSEDMNVDKRFEKMKRKGEDVKNTKGRKKMKIENTDFDTGLSLQDDEELALKLLGT